ncbi:MAG: MFS transporter [Chloroflexota bacterium]|nr:MFS transporter [Chloroflexota bacterium]
MSNKSWTLLAAVLGSGIVFLDAFVLPVALDAIGEEPRLFVGVLEGQNYVQYGYLLSLSALLVLAGALSDYYGRRRMFLLGLLGFGFTSLLCAAAPNLELLILFRILQGAAGAILVPGSLAILTNTFRGEEQGRAFGVWAGASGAAAILGPFVGGVLVQEVSWRAIFLINLPIIALAMWATRRYVGESRDERASGQFDWLGAGLVGLAVGGVSFGAIYGQQRLWQDPLAFVALGLGAAATVAAPLYFARARHPLIPLALFRSRNFSVTNVSTLLIYGAIYVVGLLQPIFMLGTLGYTASAVGLAAIPSSLFLIFLSTRFGALAGRHGPRRFMAIGPLFMAAGLMWLARMPADSEPWQLQLTRPHTFIPSPGYVIDVLPASLIFGLGVAIMVAPLTTALMRSVAPRQAGLASAINNALSRVGPQLCGALLFVIVTASFYAGVAARVPALDVASSDVRAALPPLNEPAESVPPEVALAAREASTEAFRLAMLTAAVLLVLGGAVNALGISDRQALVAADREDVPLPA